MKKIAIIILAGLFLSGCSEEKQQFENSVLEQMQSDTDIKDYNIDPERMTQCVVELTSKEMPGFLSIDPRRKNYYIGYTKLISLKESPDPKKNLGELRELFGSGKGVMEAQMNYSQSVLNCMTSLVSETDIDIDQLSDGSQ